MPHNGAAITRRDDIMQLAKAYVGRTEYLITNDKHLLELPQEVTRTLPFINRLYSSRMRSSSQRLMST